MNEPRCLGIDPGSAYPAWGIVGDEPPMARAWGMLDVGDPVAHLTALVRVWAPCAVALEIVERVFPMTRTAPNGTRIRGIVPTQAIELYKTGRITERLLIEARRLGCAVDEFSAQTWRAELIGSMSPKAEDIETTLRRELPGFPAPGKTNGHKRDALAVAWLGLRRYHARLLEKAS